MVRRPGSNVTVVTYGGLVSVALEAAAVTADEQGWELEVIDLRSLVPLDFETVASSVVSTGRCIVMHEGPRTLGMGAEIAARVQEELFWNLEAPVLRVTGFDTPYPPASCLERDWLPGVDRLLTPLSDRSVTTMADSSTVEHDPGELHDFLVPDLGEGLVDAQRRSSGWLPPARPSA